MKKITLLLSVLISLNVSAQQSDIKGVVSIHNSQFKTGTRQYVQNAQVEDDFAKATPTTTDATGTFKLVFVGADKGKTVVLSIKKAGLQVVNTPDLTAVAGQTDALKISMAHPDSIAEYRKRLYNIGKSEAEKNLYAQLKKKGAAIEALQKDAQKNAAAIEKLQKEYAELDKYAKNIEEQAQDLAHRYAPINLDDAAPLYREAFGYFQQGDLEKAMQILRGADLIGQADKILAERKAIGTIRQEANQRDSLQQQRTKDLLQVLGLKADLHKAKFEWDSVRVCLELRVNLDSLNVYNLWTLAGFFNEQNETPNAVTYFEKALALAKEEDIRGTLCINLGVAYNVLNKILEAEKYYFQALDIYEHSSNKNSVETDLKIAAVAMNLGIFYKRLHKTSEAEKYYLKALNLYEYLAKSNQEQCIPNTAITAKNLGTLYSDLKKMQQAEKYYLKALDIFEQLSKKDSNEFKSDLAGTAMNLGIFYKNLNKMTISESYYTKAFNLFEGLYKKNPQKFESDLGEITMNLGNFYSRINN